MRTKRIWLRNAKGQRMLIVLDLPSGPGQFPVVFICHGFKGNKDIPSLTSIAQALVKKKIGAVRIDFPNNPKPNESDGRFFNFTFGQEIQDFKTVFQYIKRRPEFDPKRVGICGHSLGGKLALHVATGLAIKAIVDLAGVTDDKYFTKSHHALTPVEKKQGWKWVPSLSRGTKYKISLRFYRDIAKHPTMNRIKNIMVPTLILHGNQDMNVPFHNSKAAYLALRATKKLVKLPGYAHTWSQPAQCRKVDKLTADWFEKYL